MLSRPFILTLCLLALSASSDAQIGRIGTLLPTQGNACVPGIPNDPNTPSPANNATGVATSGTLTWSGCGRATSYTVVGPDTVNPPVSPVSFPPSPSQAYGPLLTGRDYFWKVSCSNNCGTNPQPQTYHFMTTSNPPGVPTAVLPQNGATNVSIATQLICTDTGSNNTYTLTGPDTTNPPVTAGGSNGTCVFTPVTLVTTNTGVTYFWQICASNASGPTQCATFTFTTQKGYYTSLSGSDVNPGTIGSPFLTISKGVSVLSPGVTLFIRVGTYTGAINTVRSSQTTVPSGTSGNVVTWTNYPGETVTVQPPDGMGAIEFTAGGPSYITVTADTIGHFVIDGVNNVTDVGQALIYLNGGSNHNTFSNLEVKNSINFGVVTSANNGNANFNNFLRNRVHNNGNFSGGAATNGHGFYIITSDNLLEGNESYSNHGYGMQIASGDPTMSTSSRNIVRKNRIHDNGATGNTSYGIVLAEGDSSIAYDNLIYGGAGTAGGILLYTNSTNAQAYNNTIYNTPANCIDMQFYLSSPHVKNNICYLTANDVPHDAGGGTGTPDLATNLSNTNPQFLNTPPDFHLSSSSPAVNAGTTLAAVPDDFDGNLRPQGSAYDIGAYEVLSSQPPPPSYTFVSAATGRNFTATSVSAATDTHTAGNLLICATANTSNNAPTRLSNTAGDTWTHVPGSRVQFGQTLYVDLWYVLSTAGSASDVVTATWAQTESTMTLNCHQAQRSSGTAVFDTQVTATANAATSVSTIISPAQGNEYLFAAVSTTDIVTFTAGANFTLRSTANFSQESEDRTNAAAGSSTVSMSGSASTQWALSAAAFK